VLLEVEAGEGVEMKQSISWSMAKVDREIGVGAERERVMRRVREGCLTRFARSMQHDSIVGSLGSWGFRSERIGSCHFLDIDGLGSWRSLKMALIAKKRQCVSNNLLHNQSLEGSAVETWCTSLVLTRIMKV
jgi:hypothetical protein